MHGHVDTQQCDDGEARRVQHEAAATSIKALEARFTLYGKELERVEVFRYLGRLLAFDDNDTQAMQVNLMKAHKSGVGFLACFGRKTPPPIFVACFTKQQCKRSFCLGVKCGTFHLRR